MERIVKILRDVSRLLSSLHEITQIAINRLIRRLGHQKFLLCSCCFGDQGLENDAASIGVPDASPCANCGTTLGRKLDRDAILQLAHTFFVRGTIERCEYGAAPLVQFNHDPDGVIDTGRWLEADVELISRIRTKLPRLFSSTSKCSTTNCVVIRR